MLELKNDKYVIQMNHNDMDVQFPYEETWKPYKATKNGGSSLNTPNGILEGFVWDGESKDDGIYIKRRGQTTETKILTLPKKVLWWDFCFDQNMRPIIVWDDGESKAFVYTFYETDFKILELKGVRYPRCELDKREKENIPYSDVIIGYFNGSNLCYRQQREKYLKENIIGEDLTGASMVWKMGLLKNKRIFFQVR